MRAAFVFPGQGAQDTGMGVSLAEASEAARSAFSEASAIMGEDMLELAQRPKEILSKTQYAQPMTFTVGIAAMRALSERGVKPSFTAGFSLGEYAALVCAGVLSFEDAMRIVMRRGEFMAKCPGAMLAVMGVAEDVLKAAISEVGGELYPVNYNSPGQIVVAGKVDAIDALEALLKERKVRRARLAVSGAFHSPLMRPAADELREALRGVRFQKPKLPIILNLTAREADEDADFARLLEEHCVSPVLWEQSVRRMAELGAERFIECGHGGVLSGLIRRTLKEAAVFCVSDAETLGNALF